MLNKRFKIAKCKTSLKLATSRIKLMRNKKGVQINQMKHELAQLLESGQDRTARIRVEHVIREEKMVAAYDLIEIYCELIVARLPIIESQKTCPIDLKEAVTSVIFAAPRCSDIPELADAKKNFTAKYGREFVSAAVELRPDCGVSRMLVEKLSAVAPDVQTKVKVLSAVAKEHNINWDATSFEEKQSKPPDDLLNGPTYFEKASTISVDSSKIQTSYVQSEQSHEGSSNGHFDFAEQNRRFTIDAQNVTTADTHDHMGPSGLGSGMMNTDQSFKSNNNNFSSGKEKWNMEFKDATSAAQAAAESAERASIAARAAAQLSSQGKITRQYSTESYSSEQSPRVSSAYTGQHNLKNSYNNTSFNERKSKIQNQQMGSTEIDTSPETTKKSNGLRSRNDSIKENSVSYFETHETSSKKESRSRFTNVDNKASSKSANVDYHGEGVIRKQPSITPSRTHSTTIGNECDDLAFYQQKAGQRNVVDQETVSRDTKYDDVHADDESDSDDGPRFDTGFEYDEVDAKSFFPSPDRESSPKKNTSNPMGRVSSANSVDQSVNYDLSDGPEFESGTETTKSTFSGTKKSTSRVDPGHVESPPKVKPTKSRIELNDLVETGSSLNNEYEDFDTGKDLNFGTLTGGLRNKGGLKYPPYMKTSVKESPVKVDLTSKQSSFNSRASRLDSEIPSVHMSKSESDSDSDDNNDPFRVQKSFKSTSQFAPPDRFFNNDEADPEEEVSLVSKRMSTGKAHLGPGLSRRTKGQVEPVVKTVISNPPPSEDLKKNRQALETSSTSAEQKSNTRSNITKSFPVSQPDPARFKQESLQTKPDSKIYEPPPDPRKKIVESRKTEAPKIVSLSSETKPEANNVKLPSHVHPKLPDYDSLAARIQALSKMNH